MTSQELINRTTEDAVKIDCPECYGQGEFDIQLRTSPSALSPNIRPITCWECGGTGYVEINRCLVCGKDADWDCTCSEEDMRGWLHEHD